MYFYGFSGEVSAPSYVVSPYARSFFLPFLLQCMTPAVFFPRFQFVRCLPNNPFPLCVSASSVDVTALRKQTVFFVTCGSNFKPQNKAFVFQKKVCKTVSHTPRKRHNEQLFAYLAPLPPCILFQPDSTRKSR